MAQIKKKIKELNRSGKVLKTLPHTTTTTIILVLIFILMFGGHTMGSEIIEKEENIATTTKTVINADFENTANKDNLVLKTLESEEETIEENISYNEFLHIITIGFSILIFLFAMILWKK